MGTGLRNPHVVGIADRIACLQAQKPVHHAFPDFNAMEQFRIDCDQEVTLSHRLAPDVYLATQALTLNACQ